MRSLSEQARPGGRWPGALAAALTVLLAAGCATMPDSGDPEAVAPPQGAGADQGIQVRVLPFPPRDGLHPAEVLQNFLDASIADEANYKTAKQYLTGDALNSWEPDSGAVVLSSIAQQKSAEGDADPITTDQVVLTISSHEIGQLDAQHTYRSANQQYTGTFTLVNTAKDAKDTKDPKEAAARAEWRISQLPTGLVLDQVSFRNAYQQVDRYFFTKDDPQAPGSDQQPVLVPDPIYLRRRIDPDSAAAQALAQGPSAWLRPAVRSAFDDSQPAAVVNSDDPRNPKLQLNGVNCVVSDRQCREMAAQLYFTLASLNGPGSMDKVTVTSRHGSSELTATQARTSPYAPGALAGGGLAYVRDAGTGQLARLSLGDVPSQSSPVPGVLGAGKLPPALQPSGGTAHGQFAVRRDDKSAAVVSEDGKALYVAGLDDSAKSLGTPLVTSRAPHPDQGLASPSWDGYDDLFVVDRDPAAPQVLMVRDQVKVAVPVVGLADGQSVDALRVSSDGTRAALLVSDPATGQRLLAIGLVQRGGSGAQPTAEITAVRQIAPSQLDVSSVSWADPDTLLVLGKEADSVMQLHYLSTDGSTGIDTNGLQAVDGMSVVAASESRTDPVLADAKDTDHTVYRLFGTVQPQWKVVAKDGAQPAYPS